MSALYTSSFLPYGRFYNRLGGNSGMLFSYLYVLAYLTFSFLRKSVWFELYLFRLFYVSYFLKRRKRRTKLKIRKTAGRTNVEVVNRFREETYKAMDYYRKVKRRKIPRDGRFTAKYYIPQQV